jgi:hypothetical protein
VKPADHRSVFIKTAEAFTIERTDYPPGLPLPIVHPVQFCHLSGPGEERHLLIVIEALYALHEIQKFGKGVMVKTLLAAALFAAGTGKIVAQSRPVVSPAHAAIEILHLSGRGIEERPVSSEEGQKDAHALLQDRDEIMSQVSWSSSSA